MAQRLPKRSICHVADVCRVMDTLAPTALAQDWDNVGLLVGDPAAPVRRVLTCIDLTEPVVAEAIRSKADLVMAYHPPLFKPIATLRADASGTEALIHRCVRHGIAIYSTHTALDASDVGPNAHLADLCGVKETEPVEYVDEPHRHDYKLVVFVPQPQVETVADAIFAAGAGHIGDYSRCSYRVTGTGSFIGGDSTNPAVGRRGRMEYVDEVRLESVVPHGRLPAVISAMIARHPYEEPAYDIHPLKPRPVRGIGRHGLLPRPVSLRQLARKLKRSTGAICVQIVGAADEMVRRAIIVAGAAGSLPFTLDPGAGDVIITGEIRHHDALTIDRHGCAAIALGHWASERPVLVSLSTEMSERLVGVSVEASDADRDPFAMA